MPDLCTQIANPCSNGDHVDVTISVDGQPVTVRLHNGELLVPLSAEEREVFARLAARRLRQRGVTLAQFLNRITHGDEATNVKQYDLIGAGVAVTRTNIGAAYVNVLNGANGERALVDFTGCTQFRIILTANLVGTGQWGARVIRDGDSTVLFEQANLGAAGERELDTDWQTIPVAFSGLTLVRLQAKSTTAADDPVFRRCVLVVR